MFSRQHYIALSFVSLLVLILASLPHRTAADLKLGISGVFLPLFGLANSARDMTAKASKTLVPRRVLLQQIEQLRQEQKELRVRALQGEEAMRENGRLRELLGVPRQYPWKLKLGRVVGRDPANWWRMVHINLGSRDGVRPHAPVLTAEGLVGRVTEVSYSQAQVVLVGDQNCRVAVMVQQTQDTTGVIVASSSDILDNRFVELTYLPRHSALKPGQQVVTSGQGGIFPRGIPVGQIIDVRDVDFGLYAEARVKLAVDLNRLDEVWVLQL
jgi:rod shape-determining protein MreC